ncbi:MAG TPA: DUF3373 domain-containing protein [Dissulfurispiraceae bacterium]|nr:DUF3373 domain-containing protein [Dissulfurispiraceae bacterium]
MKATGFSVAVRLMLVMALLVFGAPGMVQAMDQDDLLKKIDSLSKELDNLKKQMQDMQKKDAAKDERMAVVEKKADEAKEATGPSWLEIGGDFRARYDYLSGKTHDAVLLNPQFNPSTPMGPTNMPVLSSTGQTVKNDSLLTNRLGLNIKAKATEDIQVKARLLMYKVWGHDTADAVTGNNSFFADKQSIFDGNVSHTPKDSILRVDQAYATWSNIAGQPIWFSVGRRPSTGGIPTNIRLNTEKVGTAGVPGLLVDYAFDGATVGVAPDISFLPGAYAKLCYGKGFDSGFRSTSNSMVDVNFLGFNVVPYDTDNLHLEFQVSRGYNIFGSPETSTVSFGPNLILNNDNLGDITQYGTVVMGKLENLGPGDLNLFLSAAASHSSPNSHALGGSGGFPQFGLLWDSGTGEHSRTGYGAYLGARYDIKSTGTKLGLEYNHGSKYWITFVPASDDMWTAKLGTRGNVYEAYVIQELNKKPIAKRGKAFFRLGYQYYDFQYTGSNNWVGAPQKISDLSAMPSASTIPQFFPVLKHAQDVYLTFDVMF